MERQKNAFRKNRLSIFVGVLLLGAAIGYWQLTSVTRITRINNGSINASRFPFVEERWDHPRLRLLRSREKLDQVVANGKTQFEKIILLRHWAHTQWESGGQFYYPPWDAVEILDLARLHGNRGFCAQYAIVFLQACLSMGLHARYVNLPGHFTVAVWSDDHDRWIIMDPTFDFYYEKDGVPLRGRDLSAAYWRKNWDGILKVGLLGERTLPSTEEIAQYRGYSILLRNNQLSAPTTIDWNGRRLRLMHQSDYKRYPLVGRDRIGFAVSSLAWKDKNGQELLSDTPYSGDLDDFRGKFNQTIIVSGKPSPDGLVKIRLFPENSPTFRKFLVKLDGSEYQESGPLVLWRLHPGNNRLAARIITENGWVGPKSSIKIFHKPSLLTKTE